MPWDEKWTRVGFRVFSTTISAEEITAAFGVNPSDVRVNDGVQAWLLNSEMEDSTSAEEQIDALLQQLAPSWDAFRRLGLDDYDMFIGFSSENGQGGMLLSFPTLGKLAELGIDVLFDLYPPQADSE